MFNFLFFVVFYIIVVIFINNESVLKFNYFINKIDKFKKRFDYLVLCYIKRILY